MAALLHSRVFINACARVAPVSSTSSSAGRARLCCTRGMAFTLLLLLRLAKALGLQLELCTRAGVRSRAQVKGAAFVSKAGSRECSAGIQKGSYCARGGASAAFLQTPAVRCSTQLTALPRGPSLHAPRFRFASSVPVCVRRSTATPCRQPACGRPAPAKARQGVTSTSPPRSISSPLPCSKHVMLHSLQALSIVVHTWKWWAVVKHLPGQTLSGGTSTAPRRHRLPCAGLLQPL